jgi:hypothetical protein
MKQVQRKENDGVHQNSSQKDCGRMDQVISLEIQERGEKMLETVDETIEKLCGFVQEGLESDLTANDCGNLPDLIKALAELISARAINY